MVLSMSILMELNDVFDYCNYVDQDYFLDLMDIENDEELYVFILRVFECMVLCSLKWMYGLFFDSDVVLEWRLWSKINEQFEFLCVVLLNFCIVSIFLL